MEGSPDGYNPRSRRRSADALEDGFERLVSAGRQLVDGVSGARPGSRRRPGAVGGAGERGAPAALPRLGELGRWVEQRLDGLLDGDEDDWREPWQEPRPSAPPPRGLAEPPQAPPDRRQPLQAISRRSAPAADPWPDDDVFSVPRWQRDPRPRPAAEPPAGRPPDSGRSMPQGPARPLPRSSRRRPD